MNGNKKSYDQKKGRRDPAQSYKASEAKSLVPITVTTKIGNTVLSTQVTQLAKVGDVISIREASRKSEKIKSLVENLDNRQVPAWLTVDKENVTATVIALPKREDIDFPFEEHLIVEFYSK